MKKTIFFVLLCGCTVGPNYQAPKNTISDTWAHKQDVLTTNPQTDWWKLFNEPLLDNYMELAAAHNNEILAAETNILQARALRMVASSALYPQLEANLNGTKTYFSKNGPIFVASSLTAGPSTTTGLPFQVQTPQVQPLYNALLDATWEIDLFGKTRRAVEAAEAAIDSAIESRNDVLISILGEIARNYMELRYNQKKEEISKENIHLIKQEMSIVKSQLEKGYKNQLDWESAAAALSEAESELPGIQSEIYRNIFALSILTGTFPEALIEELLPARPLPQIPEHIAIGVRSDLLRRRPDVRYAERQLAIATANIGVAVASFYPSITLSADAGFQALKLDKLFRGHSRTWDYGGNIGIPLFQGGSLVGNLRATEAISQTAAHNYQQTVLSALQETETALIAYSNDLTANRELLKSYQNHLSLTELSRKRFSKGLISLTPFIETQKQTLTAEKTLLDSRLKTLLDLITLYKALGGGWQPEN